MCVSAGANLVSRYWKSLCAIASNYFTQFVGCVSRILAACKAYVIQQAERVLGAMKRGGSSISDTLKKAINALILAFKHFVRAYVFGPLKWAMGKVA